MTDRVINLLVTLESQMRSDDVQCVIDAIEMIKHVLKVQYNIFNGSDQMNANSSEIIFKTKLIKNLIEQLK